jgi:aspartate aminotransferase
MVGAFKQRRDILVDGLLDMGLDVPVPEGAFYAFPTVPSGWIDDVLSRDVIVVPGNAFGTLGNGSARIAYTVDIDQLEKAIDIMRQVTRSLN